jgi:hypothetical protein
MCFQPLFDSWIHVETRLAQLRLGARKDLACQPLSRESGRD